MTVANDVARPLGWAERWALMSAGRRTAVAIVAITAFALLWQMRWGTIPDTSWLITVCERMLAGERLYTDIYETNPPFTVWLYLPPVAAATWLGAAPEIMVHAWTYSAALLGFLLAGAVLARAGFPETQRLVALAPAVWAMLVIYPGSAFTEREHIGVALFLPLLVLMAWRARAVPDGSKPSLLLSLLVGLAGSVLLLVKPHYAVMVLVPALWICWRRRSLWPLFAAEHWVIGTVCATYLAAVLAIHPEFLSDIYPVLADTYLRIRTFLTIPLLYGFPGAFLAFLAWRLWPRGDAPELATTFGLAGLAGVLPLVWQAKGWAYHAYPAFFCTIVAIVCLLALPTAGRRAKAGGDRAALFMTPGPVIVLLAVVTSFAPFWASQKPSAAVVQAVRASTVSPKIALIGSDIARGHPLARMVGGRWASTHVGDWLGAFSLYLAAQAGRAGDDAEMARYRAMAENYASAKREEFLARRPDIVVVQKQDAFWTKALMGRFGFASVMASYRLLAEDDKVEIFLRNDYRAHAAAN